MAAIVCLMTLTTQYTHITRKCGLGDKEDLKIFPVSRAGCFVEQVSLNTRIRGLGDNHSANTGWDTLSLELPTGLREILSTSAFTVKNLF